MRRKYLSENEVKCLLSEVARRETSVRNYCMISMAFIHGFRVSELLRLRLSDYDPHSRQLQIRRLKGGFSTTHPLLPEEHRLLRRWLSERKTWAHHDNEWIFSSRRGQPLTRQRFWQIVRQYGSAARLTVRVHPHMLRHACGYYLAERGHDTRLIQDYLGHRNIRHTVRYTASNPARFRRLWRGCKSRPLSGMDVRADARTVPPPAGEECRFPSARKVRRSENASPPPARTCPQRSDTGTPETVIPAVACSPHPVDTPAAGSPPRHEPPVYYRYRKPQGRQNERGEDSMLDFVKSVFRFLTLCVTGS